MKKHASVFLLLVLSFLWGFPVPGALALDEDGCLTCHQYPGLVRPVKGDGFKVLYIDEARYMKSVHGKIRCRKCHTAIVKVPHTGVSAVNCDSGCHTKLKNQEKIKNFPLKDFHKKEQSAIVRLDDGTACRICHRLYPHDQNKLVRALLNMHTGFMRCEVCHLKRDQRRQVSYGWVDSENVRFSGPPFGSYFNPHTGTVHKTRNYISRIGLFIQNNGQKQLLTESADTPRAKAFLRLEKDMPPAEKKAKLMFFHRHIEEMKIRVACNECHAAGGMLDFRKLGFDAKKTDQLMHLNIKGLATKYKVFYFPQLLGN